MKIYIGINVSDDWEDRMDMQQTLEREVKADRWSWHRAIPVAQPAEPLTNEQLFDVLKSVDDQTARLPSGFREFARAVEAAHGEFWGEKLTYRWNNYEEESKKAKATLAMLKAMQPVEPLTDIELPSKCRRLETGACNCTAYCGAYLDSLKGMDTKDWGKVVNLAEHVYWKRGLGSLAAPVMSKNAPELNTSQERVQKLEENVQMLLEALNDATDEIEAWGAYASEYFQKKHDLEGNIARFRAAITAVEGKTE